MLAEVRHQVDPRGPGQGGGQDAATASATPWVRDAGFGFPVTTAIRMTSPSDLDKRARGWNHGPFGQVRALSHHFDWLTIQGSAPCNFLLILLT